MATRRGISILDILGHAAAGAQALIPDDIVGFFESLAILDYHSFSSAEAFVHFGTVQTSELSLPRITGSSQPAEAPELTRGVYFRLVLPRRARAPDQNVEPAPNEFVLDLVLDPISREVSSLTPARFAPADGATPAHLEPLTPRRPGDKPRKTRVFARGALRVQADAGGVPDIRFVDFPDPFDVELSAGPVFDAWFEPPHFFIKDIGFSVGDIIVDFSSTVTAPQVTARGQPASWQGVAIEEATVFPPPRVPRLGITSFGLRDFLLGHPFGLQGEAFVELGQDPQKLPVAPAGPVRIFTDVPTGPGVALDITGGPGERMFNVELPSSQPTRLRAQLDAPPPNTIATWTLPGVGADAKRATGFTTPPFTALPGSLLGLEITRVEQIDGEDQSITFDPRHFLFAVGPAAAPVPKIDLESPAAFDNVAVVSGTASELNEVVLVADPIQGDLQWESNLGDFIKSGARFEIRGLNPKTDLGLFFLTLRDGQKRTRQVLVHIVREGGLVIGCEDGVFDRTGATVPVHRLKAEYELESFHEVGKLTRTTGGTTITDSGEVIVPDGVLAEVTLRHEPGEADPGNDAEDGLPKAGQPTFEWAQVMFDYDEPKKGGTSLDSVIGWGDKKIHPETDEPVAATGGCKQPYAAEGADGIDRALQRWAELRLGQDPNAEFLIIGRCDDITNDAAGNAYNRKLAQRRANAVADVLRAAIDASKVTPRGEQDPAEFADDARAAKIDAEFETSEAPAVELMGPGPASDVQRLQPGRLIIDLFGKKTDAERKNQNKLARPCFRRADIICFYTPAQDGTVPASTNENELARDPDLRRRQVWVPGAAPQSTKPVLSEPSYPVLVQACIGWDSPSVTEAGDFVPTKLELAVTWVHRGVQIPGEALKDIKSCKEDLTIPEFWKLKARWAHDERSGETVYSIGLDSIGDPKGLACVDSDVLAATGTFAPALVPLLDGAGLDDDGAKIAALIGLAGVASLAADNGQLILESIQAELRSRGLFQLEQSRVRFGADYSAKADWDLGIIKGKDLKVDYKNVGVLVDLTPLSEPSALDLDSIRFVFDDASVKVGEPGNWIVNPTLGKLLRVTAARVGTGSAWIEVDMGLALDLGVIHVSQATVRATLTDGDFSIELRGLEVEVDVPGVVKGSGKLSLDQNGALSSAISLSIIPIGVSAAASLSLLGNFFSLFVETRFSTPLPLAGTGLGIFGFNGHLVVNGSRALPAGNVVERELSWYALAPESRYAPKDGHWAVGIGAFVGTLPDEGFSFNAKGILAIEIPNLSVVLGVDGDFLKKPGPATAKGSPPPDPNDTEAIRLLGLVAIDSDAVTLGIRGNYRYRRLVKVDVPLDAHFPISSPDPYFLRVGSDGFAGDPPGVGARPGNPIKVTVLPDTLDLEATAFFMIEEKGLLALGGRTDPIRFDFPGFAIGAGLRFELDWGNDFIGVDVSAELLAGIGFGPLTVGAGIFIEGEVSFLLLSAGIEGLLAFRYVDDTTEEHLRIFGRLCAKVGFWKFKKRKCGNVSIGDDEFVPTAPSPIAGVDLIDRMERVIGSASPGAGPGATVWPDVIPVIHFSHSIDMQLSPGSAFDPGQIEGPLFVGSKDVQFSYRITDISIRPAGGAPLSGPLPSTWTFPSHRGLFPEEGEPPTGDERRDLHLLNAIKHRWARNMIDGGAFLAGDPVGNLERVCDPLPEPKPVCALGQDARFLGPGRARLAPPAPGPGPFASYFEIGLTQTFAGLELSFAALELAELGFAVVYARILSLPGTFPDAFQKGASAFYELAHIEDRGQFVSSLPADLSFEPAVVEPELLLAFCDHGTVQENPGLLCDRYGDLATGSSFSSLDHGGLRYAAVAGPFESAVAGGSPSLCYREQGLRVTMPVLATEIRVTVFYASESHPSDDVAPLPSLVLRAFNRFGQVLRTIRDNRDIVDADRIFSFKDESGQGIQRVELSGGFDRAHLVRFCRRGAVDPRIEELLSEETTVVGRRVNGVPVQWNQTILPHPSFGLGTPPCTLVRFTPPFDAEWEGVRIGPSKLHVGVVYACAMTAEARRQWEEAEDERQDFIDEWNTPDPPPQFVLEADTEYEIRVDWDAIVWERPPEDGQPSETETVPPPNLAFGPPVTSEFFFRTAAEDDPLPPDPPVDTEDESSFDPRKARRYVRSIKPDIDGAPHFTSDPARVVYSVAYLKDLLERFGRELVVKVRRLDPPAGSQPVSNVPVPPADTHPGFVTSIDFPREMLLVADLRILEATEEPGSCLNPRKPEGAAEELTFDLVPNALYDLLVTAPLAGAADTDADVVIARSPFRTSRYASARELLEAFDMLEPEPGPSLPIEVIVDAPLPATAELGHGAFDDTLAQLGLDPFPLPDAPRLALLVVAGAGIELAGVLIEGPEPVLRAGRVALEKAEVVMPGGAVVPLSVVRQNDAGTRVLLGLSGPPVALGEGYAVLEIELRGAREGIVRGSRFLTAGAPVTSQEIAP